jgi:V/A-type H+-transporting ATPase subunit I
VGDLFNAVSELPCVLHKLHAENGRTNIFLISMKKDDSKINTLLNTNGFTDIDLRQETFGMKDEVQHDLDAKLARLSESQNKLNSSSKNIIQEKQGLLSDMWKNLRLNELYYKVQSFCSKTSRTILFSGWLPVSKYPIVENAIKRVTEDRCYLEWNDPSEIQKKTKKTPNVPVQFSSPRFLSPFQMLVKGYAIPEYGAIDPTPFVAIAYLIMFGLMFGDIGHGLVLSVIGIFGFIYFGKQNRDLVGLSNLIIWCGGSAMIFGILFGSFFGMRMFPPLWFDYHAAVMGHGNESGPVKDIYGVLLITIIFGISIIGLGLFINWINLFRKRDWLHLLLDRRGLVGGFMYGSGIYVASYMVYHGYKSLPPSNELFFLLGLPSILLMLKPPIEFIIHKKKHPQLKFTIFTPVDFIMEWIVEMLEIFSGYLANTLSFMRVAGLGIAHVSLMVVFFQLAKMAGGFSVWSILILIAGNSMVIALEGLSAGIQSLRLNYYEFFSKYFTGSGMAYSPVTLKS